jgi:general stress protein YciG
MAKRGLGSDKMSDAKKREIQSKGGQASGGNLSSARASEMGKEGAKAQPTEAKRRGGENSHRS